MTATEIINSVKTAFNAIVNPAPAPQVPVTASAPKPYKLQDGTEITIAQAGEVPAIGDAVTIGGAPAPEGVLTLEDGSTITVDASGIITQVSEAAPVTNDLSTATAAPASAPTPTFEDRISAIEARIGQAKMEANDTELNAVKAQFAAAQTKIEAFEGVVTQLIGLCEELAKVPTADPKTLDDSKKEKFERAEKRENRILGIGNEISKLRKPQTA